MNPSCISSQKNMNRNSPAYDFSAANKMMRGTMVKYTDANSRELHKKI